MDSNSFMFLRCVKSSTARSLSGRGVSEACVLL